MKFCLSLSEEERSLLERSFSVVQIKTEVRMHERLPFLKRFDNVTTYAFAKGWRRKLQPGIVSLTIKGGAEFRMFLRLLRETFAEVKTNATQDCYVQFFGTLHPCLRHSEVLAFCFSLDDCKERKKVT